jgi:SecD/SecF fusion protein
VLIALMHDLLITAGVYALVGRTVTADTVAALLTILGYSLYDTIIVFDRVRENVPRMPRAAFSQVVNRSMSEVLTRSLITTSCTLLPVIALLLFGGSTLQDFAFALLIGVASGAYSSIFIASPVLTHWKEREHTYRGRRERIIAEHGYVPAYADGGDVDPTSRRTRSTVAILGAPQQDDNVSNSEFEQMKRDLGLDEDSPRKRPSRLSEHTAHTNEDDDTPGIARSAAPSTSSSTLTPTPPVQPTAAGEPATNGPGATGPVTPAPDVPENESVPKPTPPTRPSRSGRNRRHGRKR